MPTYQRTSDIAVLASILLSEYHSGTALHGLFAEAVEPSDQSVETFTFEVQARGNDFAGLIATLDAIQIVFNAATVAYLYDRDVNPTEFPDPHAGAQALTILREFASAEFGILEIVELSSGSFAAKVKAVFRSPITRTGIAAVASLSGIALQIMFPALVVPVAILSAVGPVLEVAGAIADHERERREEVSRRAEEAARLERQAAEDRKRDEAAAQERAEYRERHDQLVAEITRLREIVDASRYRPVDLQAIEEAEVVDLTIRLQDHSTPLGGEPETTFSGPVEEDSAMAESPHDVAVRNHAVLNARRRRHRLI